MTTTAREFNLKELAELTQIWIESLQNAARGIDRPIDANITPDPCERRFIERRRAILSADIARAAENLDATVRRIAARMTARDSRTYAQDMLRWSRSRLGWDLVDQVETEILFQEILDASSPQPGT